MSPVFISFVTKKAASPGSCCVAVSLSLLTGLVSPISAPLDIPKAGQAHGLLPRAATQSLTCISVGSLRAQLPGADVLLSIWPRT